MHLIDLDVFQLRLLFFIKIIIILLTFLRNGT